MSQSVQPIPEGFRSITPHLVCAGVADAIAFYEKAFGAAETFRLPGPDGKIMHAEMRIGDSRLMLGDAYPEYGSLDPLALKGSPVVIHLYVPDADAAWEQATAAGATPLMPLSDMFWGDRYGQVVDPFGHRWSIASKQRDLSIDEIQEGAKKMMESSIPC